MAVPIPDQNICNIQDSLSNAVGENVQSLSSDGMPTIKSSKMIQEDQEGQQYLSTQGAEVQEETPRSDCEELDSFKDESGDNQDDNPVNDEGNGAFEFDASQQAAANSPSTSLSPDPPDSSSKGNLSSEEDNTVRNVLEDENSRVEYDEDQGLAITDAKQQFDEDQELAVDEEDQQFDEGNIAREDASVPWDEHTACSAMNGEVLMHDETAVENYNDAGSEFKNEDVCLPFDGYDGEMVEIYLDDGDQEQPISSPLSNNNMTQMCAALAEPVEELRRSVSFFREGARATIKAATTEESYFQSWDMDSMRELLAQNNVQVRGASVAPHEYFVMICNEVFGDDHNNMPSKPELPATYEEFQERDNAALRIQNAYFGYKCSIVSKTLLAQNRNRSFEYSPNAGCNPAEFDSEQNLVHPQTRNSLKNAEASMFDCSLANNPAPHKFMKMDEKELDEEIEIEWRKPSWKFAKRFGAESRPHHAGGEMLPYDYKTATLGRHCMFSSWGEQLDLWNEGQTSEFAQFGSGVTNYFKVNFLPPGPPFRASCFIFS
mmetsp:Transcript_25252/g.39096  ORF Transcript_25252/g.39096 Transcript_25252/m.39096 type:complete len:546 (-) Transcript_25252:73-1710(-)